MENRKTESFEYQSVQVLKGVGPAVAEKLKRLEIYNIQDVLFHLPMRYEDRTKITAIGSLQFGQQVLIEGVIDHSEIKFAGRGRRSLLCHLSDSTGAVVLRFFHFNKAQQNNLAKGSRLRCFGEVRKGAARFEITHPEYQVIHQREVAIEQALTPIYPKTEGVHQTLLKKISDQVLAKIDQGALVDWLPEKIISKYSFPNLITALVDVHRPETKANISSLNICNTKAQQRLLFEELLAHQLSLLQARLKIKKTKAKKLKLNDDKYAAFVKALVFELTAAQKKVVSEIYSDLNKAHPMLRLVQGDVGSGKTVVAALAALVIVDANYQVAIMAPTGILSQQHYINFKQWFGEENCLLLTGKDKGKKRQEKINKISGGDVKIIIGTHALFQEDVEFNNLVFLVVDEQHRFGVHQRLSLREKGKSEQKMITIINLCLIS